VRYFLIDEDELARLERLKQRLYQDQRRMNSDEMRDNAQRLDGVVRAARNYEVSLEDIHSK